MQRPGQGRLPSLPPRPGGRCRGQDYSSQPAPPGAGSREAGGARTAMAMAWRAAPRAAARLLLGRRGIASCIDRKELPERDPPSATPGEAGWGRWTASRWPRISCPRPEGCPQLPVSLFPVSPLPVSCSRSGHTAAGARQWGSAQQWDRARKERSFPLPDRPLPLQVCSAMGKSP